MFELPHGEREKPPQLPPVTVLAGDLLGKTVCTFVSSRFVSCCTDWRVVPIKLDVVSLGRLVNVTHVTI